MIPHSNRTLYRLELTAFACECICIASLVTLAILINLGITGPVGPGPRRDDALREERRTRTLLETANRPAVRPS